MKYLCINNEHEFTSILCGRLVSSDFVHMERVIGIHVLIVVEDGTLNIEINDNKYKVHRGECVILPADIRHQGFIDDDTHGTIKYFWAHFSVGDDFSVSDNTNSRFNLPIHFTLKDFPRVGILYNQLLDVHQLTGARKKYCDFLFTALCCEIAVQSEYDKISGNKTVNNAVAWIELNINTPISLESVANALGYNKKYLSRIFKEHTNTTVNEFITSKKFTLAKQMLTGSDETVTAIASSLGFEDAGYFMRAFKKHEGITCLKYRSAYSKMYLNKL